MALAIENQPVLPACWLLLTSLNHEWLYLECLKSAHCRLSKAALAASKDGTQAGEAVFIKFGSWLADFLRLQSFCAFV